ncbi:MAG: cysteinyl-tRNA synthetase [Piccolia ochrophora]|nr:MAG: cysteinyl-tRNA synthetase [Piccolia ochrophora]
MPRDLEKSRNGSTSGSRTDSWASQDTIKGSIFGSTRGAPIQVRTDRSKSFARDAQISPGSEALVPPAARRPSSPNPSPREFTQLGNFKDYRRDLSVLDNSGGSAPSMRRNPPAALAPMTPTGWFPGYGVSPSPNSRPGEYYEYPMESPPQLSPALSVGPRRSGPSDSPETGYFDDERRPSVASATTVSSQGSQSSVGRTFHKKLQGFFGDEFPSRRSPHASETNLSVHANGRRESFQSHRRDRNDSTATTGTTGARAASPSSRPRTPVPSSDVTPWVFQDSEDIQKYGNAPIRQAPAGPDKQRYAVDNPQGSAPAPSTSSHSHHSHKLHFPGHRHNKSKEDSSKPLSRDSSKEFSTRPTRAREGSMTSLRKIKDQVPTALSSTSMLAPPASPAPSHATSHDSSASQKSPATSSKRSLFDKLKKHRHKDDHESTLRNMPGSTRSLQDSGPKGPKPPSKVDSTPVKPSKGRAGKSDTADSGKRAREIDYGSIDPAQISRDLGVKPPSKGKKKGQEGPSRNGSLDQSSIFNLDTDLSDMGGIVSQPTPMTPPDGGIFTGGPPGEESRTVPEDLNGTPGGTAEWNAPDSWAVKKVGDDNIARLREIDDAGVPPKDVDDTSPYCVRVFRVDSTFATLSSPLNSTVEELLRQLGKKSFLQDDLENYQIVMRKHDLQRVLEPGERPIAIQKRLLEQAGYKDEDRLDEIGREDNSYLCRFTFVPARLTGYYSLEKDPGLGKMQKFSHVDLQGRNLITIPITLYQKATEIISLNLSRNLSLDVPKDFIQSCINLREIKYMGNDAWGVPPSLSLASRMTYLDISNNRLEQLDSAGLDKLQGLLSIKMANNKITSLPWYFGQFRSLRNLNVSSNFLTEFPHFLCDLTAMVDLDISFNSIQAFPKNIGQLTNLERLLATNNKFSGSFPESFGNLTSLKELDVRYNGIQSVDFLSRLPQLEMFMAAHNSISEFEGRLPKMRALHLNQNPVTRFGIQNFVPTLTTLTLANANLAQLSDSLFEKIPNLEKLILDKNHFVTLTPQIGKLRKLEHLSLAKNLLSSLPPEIGCLQSLHFLDIRENNLKKLPAEIWFALRIDTLNVSSNLLEAFPKPGASAPTMSSEAEGTPTTLTATPPLSSSPSFEELGKLESFGPRRPSQGGLLSVGSSPASSQRKGSIVSVYGPGGRKASVISRTVSDGTTTPQVRKDSAFANRANTTFAGSLRQLYLADNRLNDDCIDEIALLPELRTLNLSYNELYDLPPRWLTRWPNLTELYLSGNELTSMPSDDFQHQSLLKVLHINANKFQVLPAELGKIDKLAVLDCGSNSLKYNVSNWPYDWNWNYNPNLKYLNLSGNKKLEIRPSQSSVHNREGKDLTDFSALHHLRVLGLMDVTLVVPSVPDQTEDRRVRTSGSLAGSMTYGMADAIGRNEHLSTIDMVVPKFGGHEAETLIGMFDGQALSSGGSKIAKYLHENFGLHFTEEMSHIRKGVEGPADALRRTFLSLNKELATAANQSIEPTPRQLAHRGSISTAVLTQDDARSGGVATVMFLQGMELYVANVGDVQAILIQSEGGHRVITRKHDPAEPSERQRIREAGGYVSRNGKLNDCLEVSRAFGYVQMMPAVQAAPHVAQISLKEQDEMILIASKELWEYLTPDVVVDVARSERSDLMLAAQKLRDLAIAFGATGKIMVMILGVSDLKKRERQRYRVQSMSMGPSAASDEQFYSSKRGKQRHRGAPDDSALARLEQEVDAPMGDVSMVFTDIKNSTLLWETYPDSMRSAIKQHNALMRRHLRIIGGYEVKTEGDAFMVSFPTATSALLWCFTIQSQLLEVQWPAEVLNSVHGQEVLDADGNIIFRGLSVRMGIHWGTPVCEPDPVTGRMDYFGPMVNRAARISSVADGGQITVSSDFMSEIQRVLETYHETDRSNSAGSEDAMNDDIMGQAIQRELRSLSLQGFEVKEMGERRLKGLENPEYIFLVYPHMLAGRLIALQQRADAEPAQSSNTPATLSTESQLSIDTDAVWRLWDLTLRLEMLCSALEASESSGLKPPETALLERMKNRGGEVTDRFLLNVVEHQVSRVESCSSTLFLRHLNSPFSGVKNLLDIARPMQEVHDDTKIKFEQAAHAEEKEAKLRAIADRFGVDFDTL